MGPNPARPGSSFDQVFIAGQPGARAQVVGSQAGTGADVKTTPYQKVLPAFEKTALQGLGFHVVARRTKGRCGRTSRPRGRRVSPGHRKAGHR